MMRESGHELKTLERSACMTSQSLLATLRWVWYPNIGLQKLSTKSDFSKNRSLND
jgi:hypothetical protein